MKIRLSKLHDPLKTSALSRRHMLQDPGDTDTKILKKKFWPLTVSTFTDVYKEDVVPVLYIRLNFSRTGESCLLSRTRYRHIVTRFHRPNTYFAT